MDVGRPDVGDAPNWVRDLVQKLGMLLPEEGGEDDNEVYKRARAGCCMTCGASLGRNSMVTIAHRVVVMLYCSGACYTDMQILGWIQEEHDDLIQRIEFRGNKEA